MNNQKLELEKEINEDHNLLIKETVNIRELEAKIIENQTRKTQKKDTIVCATEQMIEEAEEEIKLIKDSLEIEIKAHNAILKEADNKLKDLTKEEQVLKALVESMTLETRGFNVKLKDLKR